MHEPFSKCKWVKYPVGDTTQNYGENKKLYKDSVGWEGGHNGWDGMRPYGTHLFAVEEGVICDLKEDPGGYGKHIRILSEYKPGKYREWTYGHMSNIAVKLGQNVSEGQFVGQMGNTGFVVSGDTPYWSGGTNKYQGTHLHLNLREIVKNPDGWKYPYPASPRVTCCNYNNGTKGGIDPIPFFFPSPKARIVRAVAEIKSSYTLYRMAELLKALNI